jgi:tRNA threonylcarbamoyladenosine biosynthesis protein TsaE
VKTSEAAGAGSDVKTWLVPTPQELEPVAQELLQIIQPAGEPTFCLILTGPLGAGKTAFVRALTQEIGCPDEVASPTFPLVHEYQTNRGLFFHFDFYRLDRAEEVWHLGFEDYLASGITAVEWGEKFPEVFPAGTWQLCFAPQGDGARRITLDRLRRQSE